MKVFCILALFVAVSAAQTGSPSEDLSTASGPTDAPWNTGSTGEPWNTGSSGEPWTTGSTDAPWNTGSTGEPWNTGSTDAPWNTGSTDEPWNTGSTMDRCFKKCKCEASGTLTRVNFQSSPFNDATGEYFLIQPGDIPQGERKCGNVSITAANQMSIKFGTVTARNNGRQGQNRKPRGPCKKFKCETTGTATNTAFQIDPATSLTGEYILIQRGPRCSKKKCVKLNFTAPDQVSVELGTMTRNNNGHFSG